MISNVHKAYGDDSVYQVLVGYEKHVEDGKYDTDWNIGYDKIRAVKNYEGLYEIIIRNPEGRLLYEGTAVSYRYPLMAIQAGVEIYKEIIKKAEE